MYARDVDGKPLTFAVSGLLWNRSLVMLDLETSSEWSHLYGKAMKGSLAGKSLARLPTVMSTWKEWREAHPKTTVVMLKRTANEFDRRFYRNKAEFVLGIPGDEQQRAWPFDLLIHSSPVNDEFGQTPVVVFFNESSNTANVFRRNVDGQPLTFVSRSGKLFDEQTQSVWNDITGAAESGPLEGSRLKRLDATVSYRWAWETFFPDSTYFDTE